MSLSAIPGHLRRAVFERDGGRCAYCRLSQVGQAATFHVDHIVPRGQGGVTALENLALQCPHCSLHKSNRTAGIDHETGSEAPLFDPLRQRWDEHFRLEPDGSCAGNSAIGRATIHALRMNAPIARLARLFQLSVGLMESS